MPASTESRETLAAMLAEGFEEFGSSGRVFDSEAVLEALVVPGGRPRIQFEDFTATVVTACVVLVRYVSRSVAGAGWKPPARRSSLWCEAGRCSSTKPPVCLRMNGDDPGDFARSTEPKIAMTTSKTTMS